MKANEAPEKVYVNIYYHLTQKGYYAFTNKVTKDDIEYVRKDIFIEKAVEWLKENTEKYIWYSDYAENLGDDTCGMNDDFIEDFKKAMGL